MSRDQPKATQHPGWSNLILSLWGNWGTELGKDLPKATKQELKSQGIAEIFQSKPSSHQ